jgi:hypothetical protein
MITKTLLLPSAGLVLALALTLTQSLPARADDAYPQPSPYPVSWELTFDHAKPRRIVVQAPGDDAPIAYWYVTYHVVNNTDKDRIPFFPLFDMMTNDGQTIRSDNNIKPAVFDAIKEREHIKYLQSAVEIGGPLLQGEDQSKDGVAIWPEPNPKMGTFVIFATGFWGESKTVKVGDKDVVLHKTLQLTYHLAADADSNGTALQEQESRYVMR